MRTFETTRPPSTRDPADVQPQARMRAETPKSHTHVQQVAAVQLVNQLR
jgi:hypothetical protein